MRKGNRMAVLFLSVCLLTALCGCSGLHRLGSRFGLGNADNETQGYNIYYISQDETYLVPVSYKLQSTTEDKIVEETLHELGREPDSDKYRAVFSGKLQYKRYEYNRESKALNLYFGADYKKLSASEERLVRAAVVKTMTQFGSIIDYVSFNVDGTWISGEDGQTLKMKGNDFITYIEMNTDSYKTAEYTLYFVTPDGKSLKGENVELTVDSVKPEAEPVLNALIRGPQDEGSRRSVSANTSVMNLYVKDGLCQVDFNQGFLEKIDGQNFGLNIYSVVNTLTSLDGINRVEITVDGKAIANAPDDQKLSGELTFNSLLTAGEDESDPAGESEEESAAVSTAAKK